MRDAQIMIKAERVMEHVTALAGTIGARPPGSDNERRAAEYIRETLRAAGIADVREHAFKTPRSAGSVFLPFLIGGVLASGLARAGRIGRLIGGTGLIALALAGRRAMLLDAPLFFPLIADAESRNVIARIPARGKVERFIFLTAHMDSPKARKNIPFRRFPPLSTLMYTAPVLSALVSGSAMILSGILGVPRAGKKLPFGVNGHPAYSTLMGMTIGMITDESAPVSPGANGNASGTAALLELAAHLNAHPFEHTEVIVLFTGAASAGGVGMTAYLDQYAPPKDFSTFINVQNIGGRESALSFVSSAGISAASGYHSAPKITALVNRLAEKHPEYGVYPRSAFLLDDTAVLRSRGYEAITFAGVTRGGDVDGWNSADDTPDTIAPERITRAADFIAKVIEAVGKRYDVED